MVTGALLWIAGTVFLLEMVLRLFVAAQDFKMGVKANFRIAPERWNPRPAEHHRQTYQSHPYIIWVSRPNVRTTWPADRKWYTMATNNHGFVGTRDVSPDKPDGTIRIICLGGSTTEENTGDDPNASYPHRLEAALKETFGPKIEVLNAGVAGYSTAENMINFALRLIDFNPDVIIIYQAINDALLGALADFLSDYSHTRKNTGVEPNFWNKIPLFGRSFLFSLLRKQLIAKFGRHPWLIPNISRWPMTGSKTFNPESVRTFKRNLRTICGIALTNKIMPVIVRMNYNPRLDRGVVSDAARILDLHENDGTFLETLKANIAASKEISRDIEGVVYLETDSIKEEDFRDDWHFTTEGKKVFADALAKQLGPILKMRFNKKTAPANMS